MGLKGPLITTYMNIAEQFDKKFKEKLTNTVIDFNPTEEWREQAQEALRFASPMSLGINAEDFEDLVKTVTSQLNCYQFALLSNNLESRSANDLEYNDLNKYAKFMKLAGSYQIKWVEQTNSMRDEILKTLEPTKPIMSAVKGEA